MSVVTSAGILTLPTEILSTEVFRYLSPQFLAGRVSLVCKDMRKAVLERLGQAYVKIIGQAEYGDKAAGLSFNGLTPMDRRSAVMKVLPFFACLDKLAVAGQAGCEVEGDAGVAILDIPVNLSMRTATGNKTCLKAYRIMITRNVILGSREIVPSNQIFYAEGLKCRLPKILELMALVMIEDRIIGGTVCSLDTNPDKIPMTHKYYEFDFYDKSIIPCTRPRGFCVVKELDEPSKTS